MSQITQRETKSFETTAEQLYKVYGSECIIPMMYGLATIFKNEIRHSAGFFPLLNLQGVAASGKSFLSRAISTFFSNEASGRFYYGFNDKEVISILGQDKILVIDDFNFQPEKTKSIVKANYDGVCFTLGSKTAKEQPKNIFNKVSFIITSQEAIECETIQARSILQELSYRPYTKGGNVEFNKMYDLINDNLNYYQEIKTLVPEFSQKFTNQYSKIVLCVENELIPQRLLSNYKCIIVTFIILESNGVQFPFSVREFIRVFYYSLNKANFKLSNP